MPIKLLIIDFIFDIPSVERFLKGIGFNSEKQSLRGIIALCCAMAVAFWIANPFKGDKELNSVEQATNQVSAVRQS